MTDEHDSHAESGSIETVLSSIRRILQDGRDDAAPAEAHAGRATPAAYDDDEDDEDSVLVLDSSMIAQDDGGEPSVHDAKQEVATSEREHGTDVEKPTPDAIEAKSIDPVEADEGHVTSDVVAPLAEAPADDFVESPAEQPVAAIPSSAKNVSAEFDAAASEGEGKISSKDETVSEVVAEDLSSAVVSPHEEKAAATQPERPQVIQSGGIMSEDKNTSTDGQSFAQGYGAAGAAAESDAPAPVSIALDKQTVGATEHSFGALQQMLRRKQSNEHRERRVAITRGGNLTIEDIVRDEVRAFLKEWLDNHLSSIVQQAVQKEIERLSDR
ncbi:hypothetical protein AA23498_2492 [Acetobacter nitrogenifigens DSM 23921 = NBRC 105050]|uniref:DUF2497 domain-containing protein n=1 Tax=Acetobacter nitrogenifigens DSM 23921 = NBRC 105050 TaxID=1120919 RepID=A0A511X7T2_9PROT|nr:DUF2497 domain-containing protein [Acetobacter nitrogenifigens]GBQ95941.1 hypothetical protein AA23498_2492 [Acetobacter nitrogenifigens DSM 23921 = NBRC 105050]GEN59000.1 hypothetical protein ANI02nite_08840 [Acetobacter nitrogenifigens DSM 23921 = NBRC 105050]